jgi:dTDP-4-dehydrorhamnose 3,5-epimerase
MRFIETALPGVTLIEFAPIVDTRGYFVRTFCAREFAAHDLNPDVAEACLSFNAMRGTLRGLHFQSHPAMEDKLVRCARGRMFDVMVDIRLGSPTFGRWVGYELSEDNNLQLYAAKGFAHGFQALTDDVLVSYQMAQVYEAERSAGILWDDPDIGVAWPLPPERLSPRDQTLPLLKDIAHELLMPFAERQ